MNAVHEVTTSLDDLNSIKSESDQLRKYLQLSPSMIQSHNGLNADFVRFSEARMMVRNFEMLFERFTSICRLREVSLAAGLRMKPNNTIVEPWPMRLKKNATQDEFNTLLVSGHIGSERYVEWEIAN